MKLYINILLMSNIIFLKKLINYIVNLSILKISDKENVQNE